MRRNGITFNVVGFIDRRSEAQHAAHDAIEQKRFAWRVARAHKERDRLAKELNMPLPSLLRRQAG